MEINGKYFLWINKRKSYVGTDTTEDLAARVYDIMAIKIDSK